MKNPLKEVQNKPFLNLTRSDRVDHLSNFVIMKKNVKILYVFKPITDGVEERIL